MFGITCLFMWAFLDIVFEVNYNYWSSTKSMIGNIYIKINNNIILNGYVLTSKMV